MDFEREPESGDHFVAEQRADRESARVRGDATAARATADEQGVKRDVKAMLEAAEEIEAALRADFEEADRVPELTALPSPRIPATLTLFRIRTSAVTSSKNTESPLLCFTFNRRSGATVTETLCIGAAIGATGETSVGGVCANAGTTEAAQRKNAATIFMASLSWQTRIGGARFGNRHLRQTIVAADHPIDRNAEGRGHERPFDVRAGKARA